MTKLPTLLLCIHIPPCPELNLPLTLTLTLPLNLTLTLRYLMNRPKH